MKATKFVDLSWDIISHNTPVFPGDPEPELNVVAKLASDGMNLSTLFTGTQSGSHVDAPYHCSDEG